MPLHTLLALKIQEEASDQGTLQQKMHSWKIL